MKKSLFILLSLLILMILTGCEQNLLNNPKDSDVKAALKKINGVKSICMVTENNDPNGKLNKDGGYTGAVYFRLSQVDENLKNKATNEYSEEYMKENYIGYYEEMKDACEAGTDGGGQIEIYKNKKDAKKRDKYLSSLDGTVVSSFHEVKGTLVIRLSDELTNSQQKGIAETIYKKLSEKK